MSRRILYFLLILLVGIIGSFFYYYLCSACYSGQAGDNSKQVVPIANESKPTNQSSKNPFYLYDDAGGFSLKSNEHFNFNANSFSIIKPIAANLNSKIDSLKEYLTQHPEKELDITGLYKSNENNTSAFENLGVARANAVKNYLVNKGIPSRQLNTLGKLDDSLQPEGTIYQGPLTYHFNTANSIEEENAKIKAELELLKKEILSDPLRLRFGTNSSAISLTPLQRAKMSKLTRYLDKAEDGKLVATGHTDNTGNAQSNITLGLSRAETIKNYFVKNGIVSNKIITDSKGPNAPIDDNNTPEGRYNNRRVEITIK